MSYVYHYTTDDGFKGIIRSQELWATSIYHFEDYREFYHGRDQFIDETRALLTSEDAEAAEEMLFALNKSQPSLFVCSFTDADDSSHHWRTYSRSGGYAIGFPFVELLKHAQRFNLHIYRCDYVGASQATVKKFAEIIHKIISMCGGLKGFRSNLSVRNTLMRMLLMFIAQYKDKDYDVENEVRLVCFPEPYEHPRFRMSGSTSVPYVTLSLKNQELWKQAQIIMSPCLPDDAKHRRESVKEFLEKELDRHELPTDCARSVRLSKAPCRNTMS